MSRIQKKIRLNGPETQLERDPISRAVVSVNRPAYHTRIQHKQRQEERSREIGDLRSELETLRAELKELRASLKIRTVS